MEPIGVKPAGPGSIRADEIYRLSEFMDRMGLNSDAMRQARKRGLRARKVGRRKFIIGSEALEYLKGCPEA